MKTLFFLASLASLACMSCKAKKETLKTTESTATSVANTPDAPIAFRLIVSFISKGAGTDYEKKAAFLSYVDSHAKKPAYKIINWGREGETDYCFNLAELTAKKDLITFIEDIKKIAAGTDMLIISENAECTHQSR